MNPVVVYTITGIVAIVLAIRFRKNPFAAVTILLFAAVGCLAFSAVIFYRDEAKRDAHAQCVAEARQSVGDRVIWLYLINKNASAQPPEVIAEFRAVLDASIPELHEEDC